MVVYYGVLSVKPGQRKAYIHELKEANLEARFRKQHGNVFYSIATSITDENSIVVCDAWETREDFDAHVSSEDCKLWFQLHDKYVERDTRGDTFTAEMLV